MRHGHWRAFQARHPGRVTVFTRRATPGAVVAAFAVAAGIAALTLTPQGGTGGGEPLAWWCLFCDATSGADAVGNVGLFLPLGTALVAAGLPVRRALLAGLLTSLAIETAQGLGIPGREATLGDVLANAAGAALGATLAARWPLLWRPPAALAARLAGATAGLWLALMALSTWLLGRDASPGPRPPRVGTLASVPGSGWYQGRVAALAVDGWTAAARQGSGPVIVHAPVGGAVRFAVTIVGRDERPGAVTFLFVHDAAGRGRLAVAQRGPDAELWVRLRGARWRLHQPRLVLHGVFAPPRADGAGTRSVVTLSGGVDGPTLHLRAAAARPAAAALTLEPALGWALVVPFARPWGPEGRVLDALWVGALLVPFGYWRRLAPWGPGPTGVAATGVAAVGIAATTIAVGLHAVPVLLGGAPSGAAGWVAAAAGCALGWTAAGRRQPAPAGAGAPTAAPASLQA